MKTLLLRVTARMFYLAAGLLLIFLFTPQDVLAQGAQEKCAFDRIMKEKQQDPHFVKMRKQMEAYIREFSRRQASSRTTGTVTIPCVVHIVHTGQAVGTQDNDNSNDGTDGANPNDAQINSGITDMTNAFQHIGDYAALTAYTASMNVQFALANTAPDGSATTGIIRHDVSGEPWGATYANEGMDAGLTPGVPQTTIVEGRYWPPMDYMNIFIVHEVENATTTLGFAAFPNANAGATDGMVMLASAFGRDPTNSMGWLLDPGTNLNGTANHETGHYLNLYHTFEGDNGGSDCPGNVTCGTDSDCCADTPPHKRSSGCPADNPTGNSCTGGPNTYIHNFMDYADDACFHGFSNDQKIRMEAALAGPRVALCESVGDDPPSGTYPMAVSAPAVSNMDQTMGIYDVTLNGTTHKSWSSFYDGGYANRVGSAPKITLVKNTAYTMSVQVGVGNSSNNELVSVFIDYNNNGSFGDAGEEIFAAAGGTGKLNGDAFSINFTTPASPTNIGLRMRIISDFDNGVDPLSATHVPADGGQIEDYTIVLTDILPVELVSFNARADKHSVLLDWQVASQINNAGFEVQRKTAGEETFSRIGWVDGHGTVSENLEYTFEDKDVRPNQLYYYRLKQVDYDEKITYSSIQSARIESKFSGQIAVFPNPARDKFSIEFDGILENQAEINLFSSTGQRVFTQRVNPDIDGTVEINTSSIMSGVYVLQVTGLNFHSTQKITINH